MLKKPYYEKTFDRHERDLAYVVSGNREDIRFVKELGLAYVVIIERLHHFEGELAGQKIVLEDWQRRALTICFGWQRKRLGADGKPMLRDGKPLWVRRFNTALWYLARKNGKSILASGVALAESILTVEKGNQIVTFATKRDQAKIVWSGCEKMIGYNKDLRDNASVAYSTITVNKTDTTIRPLGRDSKTEDGLNIGFGVGDEIHAHPDRSLIEVVQSSQGARVQPMMFYITTAGFNLASPGYDEYEYAKKVMDGVIEDDGYFAFIAELDKDDDPFDESVWYKANPNLGISKTYDHMRNMANSAKERPSALNNFLVKELNRWVNAVENFIPFAKWKECAAPDTDVSEAYGILLGVDLSRTDDFTAKAKTYLLPNGKKHIKTHFYIPADTVKERERELRAPLTTWILQGFITATPGNTIDLEYIERDIINDIEQYGVNEICYDPYRAATLVSNIEKNTGFEGCVQIRQGFLTISEPTSNFKDDIKKGTVTHDGNPVMNWMVSNLTVLTDASGNIKPDKSHQTRKIDGCAAVINTYARSITFEPPVVSVYEERGLRSL
ncbi:MAG: terminase large subunit [Sulfuricurvum sp.]|nr:terminase large subunit [Sulfuricurvum sp.]